MMTAKSGSVPLFLDRVGRKSFVVVFFLAEIKIKAQDIE